MNDKNICFKENLRALREEHGLKQKDLAKKLFVTQRKVSYWETGKVEPDLTALWDISDIFGVSIDQLLGRSN